MTTKTDMSREAVTHRLRQMEGLWLLSKALADAKFVQENGVGENRALKIQTAIREILLREWNSSSPGQGDGVDRSFDQHVAPILRLLVGSRREDDLVECLQSIATKETGDETRDIERLRQMTKRLLELDVKLN